MFDGWRSGRRVRLGQAALVTVTGLALLGVVVVHAQVAGATTFTVTNCNDSGAGSLRDTVTGASPGDTINFASTLGCGVITLTTGSISIAANLTIDGPGTSALAVSGGTTSQVFVIGSGANVVISGLTVEDGSGIDGGGIANSGNLTLSDSTVTADAASDSGGGVYNTGTLSVFDSTFTGDTATNDGGAIAGISGTVTVTNSTIAGNSAMVGGDLYGTSMVSLAATIVATGGTGLDCSGTITDLGYNLDDDGSCGLSAGSPHFDLPSTTPDFAAGLANNGGPTPTIALNVASPAVDFVSSASLCPATDQRSNPRTVPCDIGAYDTDQTISFTSSPPSNPAVGGPTYTVTTVGGLSGNPVVITLTAASAPVCTITGATVSFIGGGTCTIDADQAGNATNAAAPTAQQSVVVGALSQTITFLSAPPPKVAFGGPPYQVKAVGGGSGNRVILTSSTKTVCQVAGSLVRFVGAGLCTIDANQAGNAVFAAAPQVLQSFTVGQASQRVTFMSTPPVLATVGGQYRVKARGGASGIPVVFSSANFTVCSVKGSLVSIDGAGTCTIVASQAGNANYAAAAQKQQSFYVAQRSQTIVFTSKPPTGARVGGPTYTVKALGGGSGQPVLFSIAPSTARSCSINGDLVLFTASGSCVIDANQAGNAGYAAAAQVQQAVTVAPLPLPTVASFLPTSGHAGTKVTIEGTNLAKASRVTFNGLGATITGDSATRIVVVVPTGATSGTITVTTKIGSGSSTQSFTVT